jgi:sodium-dependent dicarboxylate transporter 2/3/5
MFVFPNGHGDRLLDWKTAKNIPWGLLMVVGGSMTIGAAFNQSGLSQAIGDSMAGLSSWNKFTMIMAISVSAGFITNMMNHTAMASLLMPILAVSGVSAGINPLYLMMPAAMAISLAFMMPISTMTNMIIYDTGYVRVKTMIREGFIPNLIGVIVVAIMCYLLLPK